MARKITDTDISVEDLNNVSGNPQMGRVLGYTDSEWSPATVGDSDKVEALDWTGLAYSDGTNWRRCTDRAIVS